MDDIVIILLTSLMGCYFLSCVVVIKRTLPQQYHDSFLKSIGEEWFELSDKKVSITFTVSSILGMGLVGISFAMKRFVSNRTLDMFMIPHEKV
jgi:cellobiose-specific phosphotransferase system component IIC